MGAQDLFITPIYLILLLLGAFVLRPFFTNKETAKYFIPGLLVKFFGALSLGLIYQFYYGGGDTFTYFDRGSRLVWEAFLNDPIIAFRLIFGEMNLYGSVYPYASQIYTYGDAASYSVVRIAGFFDLFTFHTYSATALLFALLSFSGIWLIFSAFQQLFPNRTRALAFSILFLPSLFFWGSGLLKDSITLAAVGWFFWGIVQVVHFKRKYFISAALILVGVYTLYVIKIYILLCLFPALAYWIYKVYKAKIGNAVLRQMMAPLLLTIFAVSGYMAIINIGAGSSRYSVDRVFITAEETARWNNFVSEREQGSGYSLGDYDFSPTGLALKFVPGVFTTFFRPFIFEVGNPMMLMSALENTLILALFLKMLFSPSRLLFHLRNPVLVFSLIFAILFAFAVGVTTYNFGSLVRYKIPMLPFLMAAMVLISSPKKIA